MRLHSPWHKSKRKVCTTSRHLQIEVLFGRTQIPKQLARSEGGREAVVAFVTRENVAGSKPLSLSNLLSHRPPAFNREVRPMFTMLLHASGVALRTPARMLEDFRIAFGSRETLNVL